VQQGLCSVGEYCTIYGRRRERLLNHLSVQAGSSYRFSVYTTWEVSLDAIKSRSDKTSKHAIELIQILSFFHHDNIADEIFERAWKNTRDEETLQKNLASLFYIASEDGASEWDPTVLREAAALLASFSLIKLDLIHHSMSIHPLVHAWARDRLSEDSRHHYQVAAAYTLSSAISLTFLASDYRFRRMLVPHIDSCLESGCSAILRYSDEDQFEMAEKIALAFEENGRLRESMELREKILEGRLTTLGNEHPVTLRMMVNLARSYSGLGRYQRAMELLEQALEEWQRSLGSEHPDTLRTMISLANGYNDLGCQHEAMDLREKTLEATQRTLGSEHPDTLLAMSTLAISYDDLGRQQEAMDLGEKTLQATQRTLGSEHPDTLRAIYNLATSYSNLGRQQEAMDLREKTLEAMQRTLGSEHPRTLGAMYNLALSYSNLGRHQEAIELSKKALEARQRILGSEHPDTLNSMKLVAYCNNELSKVWFLSSVLSRSLLI
jgi:tetratricopeptide (TPR) repeat protein